MSKISMDVKLDFKDVLIRPKRSTLASRSQVTLTRTLTFKHSHQTFTGIPIVAANMDTIGTFSMAKQLSQHQLLTAVHKHYTADEWRAFTADNPGCCPFMAVSTGILDEDWTTLTQILKENTQVTMICLDVANGYYITTTTHISTAQQQQQILSGL